jgi:hypothetical protein
MFLAAILVAGLIPSLAGAADWTFRVRFTPEVQAEPYSGRVYLLFSRAGEPRNELNWFDPPPMAALDVQGLAPGQDVEIAVPSGEGVLRFPKDLTADDLHGLNVQAILRLNPWEREIGRGEGNGFSGVKTVMGDSRLTSLVVDQRTKRTPLQENASCKLFRVRSKLLSEFHGRDVELQAAVNLPPSYATESERRFPVIFEIPGFGGTLRDMWSERPYRPASEEGVEFLHVSLDPNFPTGHHVFADSDNNGPVGQALVTEFLPAFEQEFRTIQKPYGRLLTGHSSGGWSSLWLQITYPEVFGGTWSTAPDPVDLRDFQQINVYAPGENMYHDPSGNRRPLARRGGRVALWYDTFCAMEDLLGTGGQLHSFEAVFSPRGDDGRPRLLWNRETGAIDPDVAESWKRYDIRRILEQNWPTLGPKLKGKIHVFMGGDDTFYLDGATLLLQRALQRLDSDAVVEIHPDKDHGSLMSLALRKRIAHEMSETVKAGK